MPEKAENNWKRGLGWPFFKTEKNRLTKEVSNMIKT